MRTYLLEAKCEFLNLLRTPRYSVSTILFPVMFYIFFGLVMGRKQSPGHGPEMAAYVLSTLGAFGVIGASLFGLGAVIAVERGLGWLQLKRASPMPPLSYFTAKVAGALSFGTIVITILFILAYVFGGVRLAPLQWLALAAALIGGALPFCALGCALGYLSGPNAAVASVNLVHLPMAFLSGLWIPINMLPDALQKFAPVLPAYHLGQMALALIGAPAAGTIPGHIEALAAFTLIFAGVAALAYRRDENLSYG